MKKTMGLLVSAFLFLAILAGCGNDSNGASPAASPSGSQAATQPAGSGETAGEPVTIKWAVFETNNFTAELWKSIIDAFEKDNPDIKIEKVLMTGDSRSQYLKTLLAAGNLPDVMMEASELAKIEGVLAEVPEDLLADFEEGSSPPFNGKRVLVPSNKQLRSQTYYNKKMFADAGIADVPATWEEFIEA